VGEDLGSWGAVDLDDHDSLGVTGPDDLDSWEAMGLDDLGSSGVAGPDVLDSWGVAHPEGLGPFEVDQEAHHCVFVHSVHQEDPWMAPEERPDLPS